MTIIQITLPDQLAEEAQKAGLLSPDRIESWLRQMLRSEALDRLLAATDAMAAVPDFPALSPEEVALEIAAMRAERRAQLVR